jgi:hypothetical protein
VVFPVIPVVAGILAYGNQRCRVDEELPIFGLPEEYIARAMQIVSKLSIPISSFSLMQRNTI